MPLGASSCSLTLVLALTLLRAPIFALSAPTVTSALSRDTLRLDETLTNTVSVTFAADWPQGSFCVFPEAPDSRGAFAPLAASPRTRIGKSTNGETIRIFEMRYLLRARALGQARLGGGQVQVVDGDTLQTNLLDIPGSMALIEAPEKHNVLIYIAAGFAAVGIFLACALRGRRKRRK